MCICVFFIYKTYLLHLISGNYKFNITGPGSEKQKEFLREVGRRREMRRMKIVLTPVIVTGKGQGKVRRQSQLLIHSLEPMGPQVSHLMSISLIPLVVWIFYKMGKSGSHALLASLDDNENELCWGTWKLYRHHTMGYTIILITTVTLDKSTLCSMYPCAYLALILCN